MTTRHAQLMLRVAAAICAALILGGCDRGTESTSSPTEVEGSASVTVMPTPGHTSVSPQEPTIESSLAAIEATCEMPLSVQSDCTWHGKKFSLQMPTDFARDKELRSQACDQGYVNPTYLIATDASSWIVASDFNDDTRAVAQALAATGLEVNLEGYCP